MSKWVELRFVCPDTLVDVISGVLWENECQGITETNSPDGALLRVSFENLSTEKRDQVVAAITKVFEQTQLAPPSPEWRPIIEENWKETHRRFYPAQPLSGRFFLVPAWQANELKVPQGYEPLVLEPGRAFGTGLHQSTRLALWLTEEYLVETPAKFERVIDVGTGSGILAMAACKLGSQLVVGTDIDPEAIEVAIENAANNQLTDIEFSTRSLSEFAPASFHMVIANILLRTHVELIEGYARILEPGGVLILSGLLVGQVDTLQKDLTRLGFAKNKSKVIDEWEAVAFLKR